MTLFSDNNEICIFDIECTCWDDNREDEKEIIQISCVKINERDEIIDKFNSYVKPIKNPALSTYCKNLTGINQSKIDDAYGLKEAISEFNNFVKNCSILYSWGE